MLLRAHRPGLDDDVQVPHRVALLADTIQARRTVDDIDDDIDDDLDDVPDIDDVEPVPRKQDGRTASWGSTRDLVVWCATNGIEWSGRGRPPKALIDRYLAATQDGAA